MKKIEQRKIKNIFTVTNIITGIIEFVCLVCFLIFSYLLWWEFFNVSVIFKYPKDLMKILAIIFYILTILMLIVGCNSEKVIDEKGRTVYYDKFPMFGMLGMINLFGPPILYLVFLAIYGIIYSLGWIFNELIRCLTLV